MLFLETPGAADHRVLIASHYCQAYQIDNPVSVLLKDIVAATNPLSAPETSQSSEPPIDLRVLSGSTVLRCMGKGDLGTICKNRVRLEAEVSFTRADGVISKTALVAEVERNGRVGGFCGHIARFTGIVTREAAIDLVRQARASAGEHRPI